MDFGALLLYLMSFMGIYFSLYFFLTLYAVRKNFKRPKITTYPTVAIIVPCFNEEGTVEKTLNSLINLDYDINKIEFIVVDDGSSDNTYALSKKFAKDHPAYNIKVYKKKNGGKYTALNYALKRTKAEFFGALDADSFVNSDALRLIMSYFYNDKVMAVTPSMKIYNPKSILEKIQAIEYMLGIFLGKAFAELGSINVTPGPFSIYRRAFIEKHGMYKKAHHTEDIEMALRLQKHNYIIEKAIDAYVYTMGLSNLKSLTKQRLRWYTGFLKNLRDYKELFSFKHGNLGILILPSSLFSLFFAIVLLFYTLFQQVNYFVNFYLNLQVLNFQISRLNWFKFDLFFVNFGPVAVLGFITFLLGLTILFFAKRFAKEKQSVFLSYVYFLLGYWILYGYWWLTSLVHLLLGKKISWGHKSED